LTAVEGDLDALSTGLRDVEIARALADPAARGGALVAIHPGSGGVDAKDFAAMLLRMYLRWAARRGFDVEVIHEQEGKSAGIDGAAIRISGEAVYGHLRRETGVHRIVRVSPFGADDRRQTSFAAVEVTPDVDDTITVTILESDLEVKATCAGGPGGQNVNKVATAIRMRHVPTGVVVFARTERSHHQNRANALRLLRAKLAQIEIDRREEIAEKERGARPSIRSGHQIRSYVFSPNRQVKDERTGVTRYDIERVLDGDIDGILEAAMVGA
jgi:peptide chain release factor 2